jgi:hypothetical protein
MSSMKRDAKTKILPRPAGGCDSLDLQPTVYVSAPDRSGFCSERFVLPWLFAGGDNANRV